MPLPVSIRLRTPPSLVVALALAHGAALLLLWPLDLAVSPKLVLAGIIILSAWRSFERLRHPAARALHLARDGTLELETADGARLAATVRAETTVLPGLILLLLRVGGRSRAIALTRDATAADAHRELRLWLRWRGAAN